jgi:hypothetical protein
MSGPSMPGTHFGNMQNQTPNQENHDSNLSWMPDAAKSAMGNMNAGMNASMGNMGPGMAGMEQENMMMMQQQQQMNMMQVFAQI